MIEIRPFNGLGHADHGWLNARHHFSFAEYMNPDRMNVGPLRVWNDDTIAAQTGFPTHGHRDMEIITYVRRGAITHEDNMGNKGRTEAGDVQIMSAGTGIQHSEYNREDETTQIFQIWIIPNREGHEPRWETKTFPRAENADQLVMIASGRPGEESADVPTIHQDAALFGANLNDGQSVTHILSEGRKVYLVPSSGTLLINGERANERDGVVITDEEKIQITAKGDAEFVLADLP
ncbi:MAG: pirin family protein [Alphaproteobacteria bacterium]|nr:pirin family protein [Alphaproteobacteria bacterium]